MDKRIEQAVEGNQVALSELLFEYYDRLHRFIGSKLSASARAKFDADDVVQQAFVTAIRSIGSFVPKSDRAFYRWLETIAENTLIDMLRELKAKKRGGDQRKASNQVASPTGSIADLFDAVSGGVSSPSHKAARAEGIAAMQVHLAGLPEEYREFIQLRDLQGLSREEVALRMGRTTDEIRGLLYRARKKLRAAMGNSSLYMSRK